MDFKAQLNTDSSRYSIDLMVDAIGTNKTYFLEMFEYMRLYQHPISSRASRVINFCCERSPFFIEMIFEKLINDIENIKISGIRREVIGILRYYDIPEEYLGEVFELCLSIVENPREAIAVRANAMYVMVNICKQEPELAPELIIIFTDMFIENARGLEGLRKKLIRKLKKDYNIE